MTQKLSVEGQVWMVITPDEVGEILAVFKREAWATEWRDKYSATSKVVPFSYPSEPKKTSIRYPYNS